MKNIKFRIKYRILSTMRDVFSGMAIVFYRHNLHILKRAAYAAECFYFHKIYELIMKECDENEKER